MSNIWIKPFMNPGADDSHDAIKEIIVLGLLV